MYNPTTPGNSTQNQTRLTPNYEPTISDNPYDHLPYDLQNIPTPPKPPKHKRFSWLFVLVAILIASLLGLTGLVGGYLYAQSHIQTAVPISKGSTPIKQQTPSATVIQETPTLTAPIYHYDSTMFLQAIKNAGLATNNAVAFSGWEAWLDMPEYGGYYFQPLGSDSSISIAVFNTHMQAETDGRISPYNEPTYYATHGSCLIQADVQIATQVVNQYIQVMNTQQGCQ